MYYVLFNYTKGKKKHERSFETCRSEKEMIDLLHEHYKEIEVYRIIESARSYHLGLVVTEELIKSVLEPEKETESLVPVEKDLDKAILQEKKRKLEELEAGEPSATSKIVGDIEEEMKEEELTGEQKTKAAMDEADRLIEREKERQEQKKKGWKLCSTCNSNRVAPWNKKGICSACQHSSEGKRKYSKKKLNSE